jgi:hypothetical protein
MAVAGPVVGAQEIGAEVVAGVVPDRVDVIRVVLRVVVLDQRGRPVEAVVDPTPIPAWLRVAGTLTDPLPYS